LEIKGQAHPLQIMRKVGRADPNSGAASVNSAANHIVEAFWAARASRKIEAAKHLIQALWPASEQAEGTSRYGNSPLDADLKVVALSAYSDLLAKRRRVAVQKLQKALYPDGLPSRELVNRRYR
jgi:hypothetical protein